MPGWFESQTTALAIHPCLPFGSRSCVLFWCTKRRWGVDGWLIPDIHPQKYDFCSHSKSRFLWLKSSLEWDFLFFFFLYPHLHSETLHLAYINFVSAGAHRLGYSSWCARVHARPLQPPLEASKQSCHVGWRCCQKGDKSEKVNRMRRNVCQWLCRRPLHCDYHHLIFMRAYRDALNWVPLSRRTVKQLDCDGSPNDVTAVWYYKRVNMCTIRVICVRGQFNKRKVILVARCGLGGPLVFVSAWRRLAEQHWRPVVVCRYYRF